MNVFRHGPDGLSPDAAFDVVVVGAGGAGLGAALFAALEGASVLLVERTDRVGGTTAWSAGTSWIPGNPHGPRVNPTDTLDAARTYLDAVVGDRSSAALREAFLQSGHEAVSRLERDTEVRFRPYPKHPDYESDQPGAVLAGRAIEPLPFDARQLGDAMDLVREPIPEFTVLGGMMVDRTDIQHLLGMRSSWASFRYACGIVLRHAIDRLRHSRGTRWVMGNALVGRLLLSLLAQSRVTLVMQTEVREVTPHPDLPSAHHLTLGAVGQTAEVRVLSTQAVMVATGGFNRHAQLRRERLGDLPQDWCPGAPGHTGQLHEVLSRLGAVQGQGAASPAFWAPVSRRERDDGSVAVFPHFVMDRAKPGTLVVDGEGRRFLNESMSYHRFGLAMQAAQSERMSVPAFLLADDRALKAYGLGMVRPGGMGQAALREDGYLISANSLDELARQLQLDPNVLRETVRHFNALAEQGVDTDFHRGETAYQQNLGDAQWSGPNPCLGPLAVAPFHAVRLYPGDIGSAQGWATNAHAQMLNAQGEVLPGLYALGNDMHSIMGGVYPAPGITIGPGLVFAQIATRHAAVKPRP
jgi:hypothetical protein